MDKKVDIHTFESQMKKILEEYDEGVLDKADSQEALSDAGLQDNYGGISGLNA